MMPHPYSAKLDLIAKVIEEGPVFAAWLVTEEVACDHANPSQCLQPAIFRVCVYTQEGLAEVMMCDRHLGLLALDVSDIAELA